MTSLACLLVAAASAFAQPAQPFAITIRFTEKAQPGLFTGRVFVVASTRDTSNQPAKLSWFKPGPFFAMDVKDWKPNTPLKFSPSVSYPVSLEKLEAKKWYFQAILDRDEGSLDAVAGPGNAFSPAVESDRTKPIELVVDKIIPNRTFKETDRVKLFETPSKLLTAFHGKPYVLRAGVVLPKSFATSADRKYPVVYEITGFGGDHFFAFFSVNRTTVADVEAIHVVLDANCRLGHHVFADSANNGPVGQALVEELIPQLEAKFRGIGQPGARFVTGHSSGGWSSLWLQTRYPDYFGGVWSTAPDPVDFRDFQRINIYADKENMFKDAKGAERPIARSKGKTTLWYRGFSDMEEVMGRGGQLASFEAVFSPKGPDGKPQRLWDRQTGAIDSRVAKAWEAYDIRLITEKNWSTLGPKLAGKLHVYMGDEDTFYLEGATRLLKASMATLKSDAKVELFAGKDHGSVMTRELRDRIGREMAATFRKSYSVKK